MATRFSSGPDFVYTPPGWSQALKADVISPIGVGPWPAVILIYGGSWSTADHRWQMRFIARKLAARGYLVMRPTYRGAPDYHFPAPVDDLREAVRWLRRHAAELHVRPDRVAAYGFSAGAHLAEMLGTLDGSPEVRVEAVVAAAGPADLTLDPGVEVVPRFLGATYAEDPARFRAASPILHVSADDPPVFLYHGTEDRTVSPDQSRNFKAALDRAGVRAELYWVKGRGHAGVLWFNGGAEAAAIDFLDSVLR